MGLIPIIIFFLINILFVALLKGYKNTSLPELRRLAREKDAQSTSLYKVAIYARSVDVLFLSLAALSFIGLCISSVNTLIQPIAFSVILIDLIVCFIWLPNSKTSNLSVSLAQILSSPTSWIIKKTNRFLNKLSRLITAPPNQNSKIYNKQDLVEFIKAQSNNSKSKITKHQLQIIEGATTFNDRMVRDVMTPRKMLKTISSSDTIGPVLMGELHESGFSRFPVYRDSKDNIVGTLSIKDLLTKHDGQSVSSAMSSKVYFVNEDKNLDHVLQAFLRTQHHIFMVVNNFEEIVGVVTVEDVLEQILGEPILDEFDHYSDIRKVAELTAEKEHQEHKKSEKVVE